MYLVIKLYKENKLFSDRENRRRFFHQKSRAFSDAFVDSLAGYGASRFLKGEIYDDFLDKPTGIAILNNDVVLVSDSLNNVIFTISLNQVNQRPRIFAVTGSLGLKDGRKEESMFNRPIGIAVASDSTIYVADSDNHIIRRISRDGTISINSGLGNPGSANGNSLSAKFFSSSGICIDPSNNNIYVADTGHAD